jgi:hypothetical protein
MNFACRTGLLILCVTALGACNESDSSEDRAGTSNAGGGSGAGAANHGGSGVSGAGGMSNAAGSSAAGGASGDSGHGGSGGASGTAGAADAGADGGGGGSAVAACATGNVCDGFETYKVGGGFGDWKTNGTSGMLSVDSTHVFSGLQSAHFHVDAGANKRLQLERMGAPIFPAQNNAFWGRVMVWASDLPMLSNTENKNVHYDIIQASGGTPGEYRIAGMGNVLLNYEPHDCYYNGKQMIPQDRWACWEWLYDGTKNVIEFYIDNALQARVESKGSGCVDGTSSVWQAPQFNQLRMGWVNYQSKGATNDLWMDDFAVGPQRIGCPASQASAH